MIVVSLTDSSFELTSNLAVEVEVTSSKYKFVCSVTVVRADISSTVVFLVEAIFIQENTEVEVESLVKCSIVRSASVGLGVSLSRDPDKVVEADTEVEDISVN